MTLKTTDEAIADKPLFAAFRRSDPDTSEAAAKAVRASGAVSRHEQAILQALASGPGTKDEIAARIGFLTEQQVARRMCAMKRAGKVTETGERRLSSTGNTERVWRLLQ